jgi:hypothetical protein
VRRQDEEPAGAGRQGVEGRHGRPR